MIRRLLGRGRSFLMPGSLRYQLLSRSLFIMAALLLLIGGFQYVLMQHFLFQNKAQSIKSQLIYIPPDIWLQADGHTGSGTADRSGSDFTNGSGGRPGGSIANPDAAAGSGPGGRIANPDAAAGSVPGGRGGPNRGPESFFQSSFFVSDSTLAFYDMNGNLTTVSENPRGGAAPLLAAAEYRNALEQRPEEVNYRLNRDAQGIEQLVVLVPISNHGHVQGVAELATLVKPLHQELLRQLLTFLALSLLALLIGLLMFKPILRRTLVPLSRIVDTVEKIDSGNLDEQLPAEQGQIEIDRLSGSLGRMLERLKDAFEAEKEAKEHMRRFIADASHELRTPLTSIHGFLEVLLRGAAAQPEQLHRALTSMYGESERLNKLVHDLLMLARLDRSPTVSLDVSDLGDVLHDMEDQLRLLAGDREARFRIEPGVHSRFDRDNIKQVVLNLFHNAVQHTDPGSGKITLELYREADQAVLAVADNGPGIPEEHLPHLFERFYRVDSSRTRKHGGAGLGLAITKSIVDIHEGTIETDSRPGAGSRFLIRLPLVEKEM